MNSIRVAGICIALVACQDEPARPTGPTPTPVEQGVQAYITVDNLNAAVGQTVRVRVEVQVGSQQSFKVGSYTGRLRFNPAKLAFRTENPVQDGLRVSNPAAAPSGEIRFAGASAQGFNTLVLYDGSFEVRAAGYASDLSLVMEEMSAARTLTNLQPQLRVQPRVFLSPTANR
jgi:hypothetical protein